MSGERKQPGRGFWATVALTAVLVVYPLSIGPAYWFLNHYKTPDGLQTAYRLFYWPIIWLHANGPPKIQELLGWYVFSLWG